MGGVNLWKCLSGLQRIRERGHAGRKGGVPPRWGRVNTQLALTYATWPAPQGIMPSV